MILTYNDTSKRFEFRCGAEEKNGTGELGRYMASQAGLKAKWLGRGEAKELVWLTDSPLRARALADYATPQLRDQIRAAAAAAPLPVLSYRDGTYIWSGPIEGELDGKRLNFSASFPKAAKFRFTRVPSQEIPGWREVDRPVWWTANVDAAKTCQRFADESARNALAQSGSVVALSRALDHSIQIPAPDGLEYMGYQKAGVAYALERFKNPHIRGVLFGDEMGLGKAQPLDAQIVTPRGFEPMEWMQVGTSITGQDGRTHFVTGVYPQGMKDIYRLVFSDGTSTECCEDHLWQVNSPLRKWTKSPPRVFSTRAIAQSLTHVNGNNQHFIPLCKPVHFSPYNTALPLHPYLLGSLLGDGGIAHSVIFTTADAEMAGRIAELLPEGVRLRKCKGDYDYHITCGEKHGTNVVLNRLRALGLYGRKSNAKFIPRVYQTASIEERVSLLQGLLDTDGYASKDNVVQFTSVSQRLINDTRRLVESLGGIARLTEKKTTGQLAYTLTLALPAEIAPFRLTRKAARYKPRVKYQPTRAIVSVEYVGVKAAQCISTDAPEGLYLTDSFIVTHNTVESIGVVNTRPDFRRVLVVCPASIKRNWQRELVGDIEINKVGWLVRPMTVGIADSSKSVAVPDTEIVIINFEMLGFDTFTGKQTYNPKKKKMVQEKVTELRRSLQIVWDLIIIDEVHRCKNPDTTRTKLTLSLKGRHWLMLSGTPLVNRPRELWTIAHHLAPAVFPNHYQFLKRYCSGGSFFDKFGGAQHLPELQEKLRSHFMIRRLKSEVLTELPPKRRQVIELPADKVKDIVQLELTAYDRLENSSGLDKLRLRVEIAKASDNIEDYKSAVKALRKGITVNFEELSRIRRDTALAKVPMVKDHLIDALGEGNKILLFTYHKEPAYQIAYEFPNETVMITGDSSLKERDHAEQAFNNDNSVRLLIGTIGAAGVGLNLQKACSHGVFAELDWVPGNVTQAEDRIHRKGQRDGVLIQHLVLEGSLDARMARVLVEKQEIADKTLDTPGASEEQYVLPTEMSTRSARPEDIAKAAGLLSARDVGDIQALVRVLSQDRGEVKFSAADLPLGKYISDQKKLTTRLAALGKKLIYRYRHAPALATLKETERLFKEIR